VAADVKCYAKSTSDSIKNHIIADSTIFVSSEVLADE